MSRVLVLGGMGMLGHQLARVLPAHHAVTVTARDAADAMAKGAAVERIGGLDLRDLPRVRELVSSGRWEVVVNAAGAIKHRATPTHAAETILINAALPQELAAICAASRVRLIHFSTDCVFSGAAEGHRGPDGYRENDPADARDLYGLSKLLGEPASADALCIRTSLIGPELRGHHGLLDWYLHEQAASVGGYTRALFSGLTTPVAARLVDFLIREQPALAGLWHVAAEPVSKYELLGAVRERFGKGPALTRDERFFCDRRLDGERFRTRTGWQAPSWPEMIDELARLEPPCAS